MHVELNLSFPDRDHVVATVEGVTSGTLPFASPLTEADRRDLAWYVETYGAHSLGDPDDEEAHRIRALLPVWGARLFDAVFSERAAARLFNRFQDTRDRDRWLTVSAEHPAILALPWELLHDSAPGGGYLFLDHPRISVRRTVPGATGGVPPFPIAPKDRLHLLFVVSRPEGAGFLDPRADPQAVLDALDEHAPGRVLCEFLRPPTLDALLERLEDERLPAVDVVHFDGHGVFDREGGLPERLERRFAEERRGPAAEIVREESTREARPVPREGSPNTGYLLFETKDQGIDLVSAERLGANLHRHRVALVILSACQSAAMAEGAQAKTDPGGEEDSERPMGSVAARLTATGIPAVVAMTHSVLVPTTRALFGAFYKDLARQRRLGEALDNARRHLWNHPEKYEVQREAGRVWLKLEDWFLPALYQSGKDVPLLTQAAAEEAPPAPKTKSNLPPAPEAGFFGRRRELWEIERWLAGTTRRVTITGFGGQGKTALALEAGRWLLRSGLFASAVFVDYARIQSLDAVQLAVSTAGSVLGDSLADAEAVTAVLRKTPTLVILDNLEALDAEPLRELLDAAAAWSEAGGSRLLCTTRRPEFEHPAYRVEGTNVHRRLRLQGLGSAAHPDDALEWLAELSKLPPAPAPGIGLPKRQDLIDLFAKVRFHPLSIRVLAQQLKTREARPLGDRLEELLAAGTGTDAKALGEDTPAGLLASLRLSLERLDEGARRMVTRLGVFQGGAMEPNLLAITEIPEAEWPPLRRQLEAAALVEAESLPGVSPPFLRFHPTLAPLLRAQLTEEERARWSTAHRRRYAALAGYLYQEDRRTPHEARAVARRELPNLLHAVHAALAAGEPKAVDFADWVNRFLLVFGLKKEAEALLAAAQAAAREPGSPAWVLAQSNRGEQLRAAGDPRGATAVFSGILERLGGAPSYGRAVTLSRLGLCLRAEGHPELAAARSREALSVLEELEQGDGVRRLRGVCLTDLADALRDQGKFAEARESYEAGLEVYEELNSVRDQVVTLGQLGALAFEQQDLAEALERYQRALALSRQLGEPGMEATSWHQLGIVYYDAREAEEAERCYRESARIRSETGDCVGAAATWSQLAQVHETAGKPDSAETWYRKALDVFREAGNPRYLSSALNNLAHLLRSRPGRLEEARRLGEEALAIKVTLNPGAAEIWRTYYVLAEIAKSAAAEAANDEARAQLEEKARAYRRRAREAKRAFPGTRHEQRRHASVILEMVAALAVPAHQDTLEKQLFPHLESNGWTSLLAALRRILSGERDADALCDPLDLEDSMIVEAILQGIANPDSLHDLMPEKGEEKQDEDVGDGEPAG